MPLTSALTGAVTGMEPGWAVADELTLAMLNQAILMRRIWASEEDAAKIKPLSMPWHTPAEDTRPSSKAEIAAFFGASGSITVTPKT